MHRNSRLSKLNRLIELHNDIESTQSRIDDLDTTAEMSGVYSRQLVSMRAEHNKIFTQLYARQES